MFGLVFFNVSYYIFLRANKLLLFERKIFFFRNNVLSILRCSWWAHDFPFDHNGTYFWKISRKLLSWTSSLIQFTMQLHNHLCQHNERGKTEVGQVSRKSGRRSSLRQHCCGVSLAWEVQAFHLLCSVTWSFKKLPVQYCIIPGFVCLSFPFQVLYILEVWLAIKYQAPDAGLRVWLQRWLMVVLLHQVHARCWGLELRSLEFSSCSSQLHQAEKTQSKFCCRIPALACFWPQREIPSVPFIWHFHVFIFKFQPGWCTLWQNNNF